LALTGRAGQGVVAYRSEFLHLWILGGPELDAQAVIESLHDLERGLPQGAIPPPGVALPVEVQHVLSGLHFLQETLWDARPAIAGLVHHEGRVWALHAGLEPALDQMTGAPVRWRWHEWEGALAWVELAAGEVWRLGLPQELFAHYRPALRAVPDLSADAFAAESRQARRRRHRREQPPVVEAAPPRPVPKLVPARVPAAPKQLATPRVVRPRFVAPSRRTWLVAGGALAAVIAVAAIGIAVRKPIAAALVGRYELALTTSPAGARVRVDGKPVTGRTPLTLALAPGEHRVDVNYGEYGNASFTIDGERGETLERSFAWTGALGVASADSTVRLRVALDGKPIGTAPLWKDAVPVGRHRLSFQAPGVRAWEEEVQVRAGQSARVSASPVRVPNYGLVTARAELVSSDGVEDLDGIPVFVDGQHVGTTPLDLKLTPGPHSIKVARAAGSPSIHLIDVQPGGRFFASAEFGRPADPLVAFEPPVRFSRATPPAISVRLAADLPLPIRQAAVHLKPAGGSWTRLPIAWNAAAGKGSFAFPLDRMPGASALSYYVEIETREGEEYFSELHTLPIVP
jgi:hypothetical protein